MFRPNFKQGLSIFLAALMTQPPPMTAASSASVLGSINTYGAVTVGQTKAAASSTLFAGDTVATQTGSAVVQYEQGARVLLAKSSTAVFTPKTVELQQGQMSFQSVSGKDVIFNATSLRLEPITEKTSADVVVKEGKASVSVREGSLRAVDPTGVSLAVIPAGEAKLFAMASPSAAAAPAPAPSASASAAPFPGGAAAIWILLVGAGATVATVTTALTLDNDEQVEEQAKNPSGFLP